MAKMARILVNDKKIPLFELDFSSSERFYRTLLNQVFANLHKRRGRLSRMDDDRQREILTMHAAGQTLDEIGKLFGVTRERIRQIERKVWSQIALFNNELKNLENVIVAIFRKNNGFERLDKIQDRLQEKFGWSKKEIDYLLNHYLGEISPRFVFVNDDYLALSDHICWKCDYFKEEVKKFVREIEDKNESQTIDEFSLKITKCLNNSEKCRQCSSKVSALSSDLFLWLFKNDPELQKSQNKMTVRRSAHFLGLNRSVLLVLKIAKRPLSKQEILTELKKMFPKKNFTLKQIQSTTSNSPQCFDEIFLWDRGGIHSETLYIHKDYIKTDLSVLSTIEKILLAEAKKGKLPQIRLNRLFNLYSEECIANGIPNVYALFSALKVRACPGLSFQRSPYIGLGGNRQKISNAKILEDYVRQNGGPVSRQEMRTFGKTLGLQDEHISNTIVLTNLLATQRGYIYRTDAPEETPEFQKMIDRLKKNIHKKTTSALTVDQLFFDEAEVCRQLKIIDPKMLYSLLKRCGDESLDLRYPQIGLASKRRKKAAK